MVPEGWNVGTIKDLAETVMGFAFKSNDFTTEGVALLRMGNIYQNSLDLERNPVFVPEKYLQDYSRFVVQGGDLVMSMTGTMGKRDYGFVVQIPTSAPTMLLNQRVMKLEPKERVSSGFLLNLLRSELVLSRLYSLPGGTKQANLSAKQIQDLPAPIPPEAEQKKIAQILSIWDQAITATERLLENSQQRKKGLMQQLLTGTKRLPGFKGEWEEATLGELATVSKGEQINGSTLSDAGAYPVINGGVRPSGYTHKTNCEADTITISEGGNSCGYVALQRWPFWLGGHCYALKDIQLNINLLYHLLKLNESKIMRMRVGSGLPNIQKNEILGLILSFPKSEVEHEAIGDLLATTDRESESLMDRLDCLKQEKKALMQQLLTGKRRVQVDTDAD